MFYQQSLLLAPLMLVPILIFLGVLRRSQQPTEVCRLDGETLQFWRGKQCLWQGTLTNIEGLIITGGRNRLIVLYLKGGDSFSFFYYLYDWPDLWKIKALIPNNRFHDKPAGIDWNWLPDNSSK